MRKRAHGQDKFRKMLVLRRTECVCVTGWVPFKNTLADFKMRRAVTLRTGQSITLVRTSVNR